jgi:hypothetical protein
VAETGDKNPARARARESANTAAAREYLVLAAAFVVSRVLLVLFGLEFSFSLDWMFLADPADLREHLLSTTWRFHAFPPGMNLLSGVLLKLSTEHTAALAHVVFAASGLLLTGSVHYLLRALGVAAKFARAAALVFSLLPPTLYLENLYLYDYPAAALLALLVALMHRALVRPSFGVLFALFSVGATLVFLRSAFHLVWFACLVLAVAFAVARAKRSLVLRAALLPACLASGLYLKNSLIFGVFGATSWGSANLAAGTTQRLAPELRKQWVREGKLSAYSEISVFAAPRAYLRFFESSTSERYPEESELDRPSLRSPNYNHWFFLEVNRARANDVRYFVSERPGEYLRTVLGTSLPQFFSPTTRWHPRRNTPASPHFRHQEVLGGYERVYSAIVHDFPIAPYGLYLFLPLLLYTSGMRARALYLSRRGEVPAEAAVLAFVVLQVAFVAAVSAAVTFGESSRYRFLIEPLIFVLLVSFVWRRFFARKRAART